MFTDLISAFKGGGSARVPIARGFASPWASAFEMRATSAPPFDYATSLEAGYASNPVAQRAVRIVAEGVGAAPVSIAETKDAGELLALVTAPSAGQSLVETIAAHLLLHGNAFVQVLKDASGRPVELFALRPERVTIRQRADGWPESFAYHLGAQTHVIPLEDEDGWPGLIHLKCLNPGDDHYGAGALSAAAQAIAIHNAASRWNHALLENAAPPSGALVYAPGDGQGLSADQFERLKAELASAFQGNGNAGRPMLLEGGLSWQRWVRRARGAWRWLDGVDVPLNEEREAYRVGLGPQESPHALWELSEPCLSLAAVEWDALRAAHPSAPLWVRQIGTHALSLPTLLPA